MQVVSKTEINEYPLVSQGKVRDIYKVDEDHLLIVTTDRMSAFDVIMPNPIPYKGAVLNQLTIFWMQLFSKEIDNHLKAVKIEDFPEDLKKYSDLLDKRAVLVKRADPLPIECIVRGYISGSGWKDYKNTGMVCGYELPSGLKESDKLPKPLFTPSTKAEIGEHDENITLEQAKEKIGQDQLNKIQKISLDIYQKGVELAEKNGLIIADTKFEFGLCAGKLTLIDEVLTPDSSRFWPLNDYVPGKSQPSFDKQYLRDWLSANWDKKEPAPELPQEVIQETQAKYLEAYKIITGKALA